MRGRIRASTTTAMSRAPAKSRAAMAVPMTSAGSRPPVRDRSVASLAICSSSREVGARPCLRFHSCASSRSFSWTWMVRVE